MSAARERAAVELGALGFTPLEADAYLHLAREGQATGYRVARALGKAAANVYAALESLRAKGAVVLEEGESRVYRALPADRLEAVLAARTKERTRRLAKALTAWQSDEPEGGVYRLADPAEVLGQAEAMLRAAKTVVVADLFPGPLERLRPVLEEAAARGVTVGVQAYAPAALAGVDLVVSHRGRDTVARWPGQWIALAVDGAESLVALLTEDGDEAVHSTWTTSPHVAWTTYSSMSGDLIATRLTAALEAGATREELVVLAHDLQARYRASADEAYRKLLADVRRTAKAPARKGRTPL